MRVRVPINPETQAKCDDWLVGMSVRLCVRGCDSLLVLLLLLLLHLLLLLVLLFRTARGVCVVVIVVVVVGLQDLLAQFLLSLVDV